MNATVVLSTYNGEKYIYEQLESIKNQTYKNINVIICDDCSSDNTVKIISDYIKDNNLSKWEIMVNKKNKGWKKNFFDALKLAEGDIIFPCDQDDIWEKDKIETMVKFFSDEKINVLFGKYAPLYMKENNKLNLWTRVSKKLDKINSNKQLKNTDCSIKKIKKKECLLKVYPGCTLAFRKDFFNKIMPYWRDFLGHDAFLMYFSRLEESCYLLNKIVIQWRQYSGSTSRPKMRNKIRRIDEIERDKKVLNEMKNYCVNSSIDYKKFRINKYLNWNNHREKFVLHKKLISGIKLLFHIKCYERKRALFTDWIYTYNKK